MQTKTNSLGFVSLLPITDPSEAICKTVFWFSFCNKYPLASGLRSCPQAPHSSYWHFFCLSCVFIGCVICGVNIDIVIFLFRCYFSFFISLLLLRTILISLDFFFRHSTTSFVSVHFFLNFCIFLPWLYSSILVYFYYFAIDRDVSCLLGDPPTTCFLYIIFIALSVTILCIVGWSCLCIYVVFMSLSSFYYSSCLHMRSVCISSSTVCSLFLWIHF